MLVESFFARLANSVAGSPCPGFMARSVTLHPLRPGVRGMAEMACSPHARDPKRWESTRAGEFRKYPAWG